MQQKDPLFRQTAVNGFHECPVILQPHMLKHPDGDDLVEASFDLPVIFAEDRDRPIFAIRAGLADLLLGDVDGRDRAAAMLRHVTGQAAPAAADVQKPVAGLQIQFPPDHIELLELGLLEIIRALEVAATVLVARIEKREEQVVSQIVVSPGDDVRPGG